MTDSALGGGGAHQVIRGGTRLQRIPGPERQASYDQEVGLLIRATQAVMLRAGCTEQPKIADIVSEAGMSNQAFYRHFRSRDDVIVATYEQGLLNIHAYLRNRISKQHGLEAEVGAWIDGVLTQIDDEELSDLSRVIIWNMSQIDRSGSQIEPQGHARIRGLLARVLAEHGVDQPEQKAVLVHTLVMGLTTSYLESAQPPTAATKAHLLRFCLDGITAHRQTT